MADTLKLEQYRRAPQMGPDDTRSALISVQEISDKLNELIRKHNALVDNPVSWESIGDHPTTLSGYGITDAAPLHHTHPISDVVGLQSALDALAGGGGGGGSVSWDDISGKPSTFPPSSHNHDGLYYRKSVVDTALAGKADVVHNHDDRYYTKPQSDSLVAGKVNRLGGDYLQGFAIQPMMLTFDMEVPEGHVLQVIGPFDIAATLDVGGIFDVRDL